MATPLQSDGKIPLHIYESAAHTNVGIPLKKLTNWPAQIMCSLGAIVFLCLLGWLGYNIYGAIAFIFLSQTYPTSDAVPIEQLGNYFWLQNLHDTFWQIVFAIASPLLGSLGLIGQFYQGARIQIYLCSEGILTIYKKKAVAMRWDDVQEFYLSNGYVTRLVREDKTSLLLPFEVIGIINKASQQAIVAELMRRLLPVALGSYERGEAVSFGELQVSQQGISLPKEQISWDNLGAIALENSELSAYYVKAEPFSSGTKPAIRKWHIWQKRQANLSMLPLSWPNLPVFVALADQVLDRQDKRDMPSALNSLSPRTLKETAFIIRARRQKRYSIGIAAVLAAILVLPVLIAGVFIYLDDINQQQAEAHMRQVHAHDAQVAQQLRIAGAQLARQPYYAHVPGPGCDHGKAYWQNEIADNIYTCRYDGLLMTQHNYQYQDEEFFSFLPNQTLSSGHDIPHHYRLQVQALIYSGGPTTCAILQIHIQNHEGRQYFSVCADGTWWYYFCDLHCTKNTGVTHGHLHSPKYIYTIAADVTDTKQTLIVDGKTITTIHDSIYSSTNQLALAVWGEPPIGQWSSVLFSDFRYTPYP